MAGGLRQFVQEKYLPNRGTTDIMELWYDIGRYKVVLWLERKRGAWRVVGDARFAKGVVF